MNVFAQLAIVVGFVGIGAGGTFVIKGAPVRVSICDPATLNPGEICAQQVVEPVIWVDARPRKDWEKNGMPGSILWNLDPKEDAQAFEVETMTRIIENPLPVVVYCSTEDCGVSKQVADKIRALDSSFEVKSLRGGWQALREAGRVKDSNEAP